MFWYLNDILSYPLPGMLNDYQKFDYHIFYCSHFPDSTKPQAWILRKSNDGCNSCSVSRHSVLKRDRIPLLKSYRQALEQKCGFPGVSGDNWIAMAFHVPAVSMAMGQKMCVPAELAYFEIFCCAAWSAAAPGVLSVLAIWFSWLIITYTICIIVLAAVAA